jgi:hypothetical protein
MSFLTTDINTVLDNLPTKVNLSTVVPSSITYEPQANIFGSNDPETMKAMFFDRIVATEVTRIQSFNYSLT